MKRGLKDPTCLLDEILSDVTTLAPMKRGLKVSLDYSHPTCHASYNPCPDEKGTERTPPTPRRHELQCYNPCPDEKGTESHAQAHATRHQPVTTLAPMKRGLKDHCHDNLYNFARCYNPCPDEKGTERLNQLAHHICPIGYNPCPDEKGTESANDDNGFTFCIGLQPLPR